MLRAYLLLCFSLFTSSIVSATEIRQNEIWLLVDTHAKKIEVKKGEQTVETLEHVAIGRGGAGLKTHRGDNITPFGEYRIGWIGDKSMFKRFLGLNYPSAQDAENAFEKGIINEMQYKRIVHAHELGQIPPQDTPLGGQIGIHGLGSANVHVHEFFDWTHGCIALTNSQIDHLSQLVDTGTLVKIK